MMLDLSDLDQSESDQEQTITGQQAAEAQTALRKMLGLPPEQFPLSAFIGMVSDEIEQLRAKGKNDEEIATLIADAAGVNVSAIEIEKFYASPKARGHYGSDISA